MAHNAETELNFSACQLKSASVTHGPDGTLFRCQIGPLPGEAVTALKRAAHANGGVHFLFAGTPVRFIGVEIVEVEPGWVQLVGRLGDKPNPGE